MSTIVVYPISDLASLDICSLRGHGKPWIIEQPGRNNEGTEVHTWGENSQDTIQSVYW